jgi:hypothetical protein
VVFVADDLGAWLVSLAADGARRKLTTLVLGDQLDRGLQAAAIAAIQLTATELSPKDDERAQYIASVINEVFRAPVPEGLLGRHVSVLGAMQAGIADQLSVLDDASLTGQGQSSADALGISAAVISEKLTGHLLQQITARAAHGGALTALASQLNHDRTYLQGRETHDAVRQIRAQILNAVAPRTAAQTAESASSGPSANIALHVEQCFEGLELDQHEEAERRLARLFLHLSREQERAAVAAIIRVATTTGDHTTQLVACNLIEAADRLDLTLIELDTVEKLATSRADSLRGLAASLLWQWAESMPGRVPVPLLGRLTQPSTEDWYVHSPARCAAKQLLLSREAARAIFDRMAGSRERDDRDYAASDLLEVAGIEPRAVPIDLARKLARDEDKDVAAQGVELLRIATKVTDGERVGYYHRFGI